MKSQEIPEILNTSRERLQAFEGGKSDIVCLSADATLADAARLMKENHVGNVIIIERQNGKAIPIGIVTDRDLALEAESRPLRERLIRDVVGRSLAKARVGEDILNLIQIMKNSGVTRLPLVREDGTLASVVTARKLLKVLVQGLSDLTQISDRQKENERDSTLASG